MYVVKMLALRKLITPKQARGENEARLQVKTLFLEDEIMSGPAEEPLPSRGDHRQYLITDTMHCVQITSVEVAEHLRHVSKLLPRAYEDLQHLDYLFRATRNQRQRARIKAAIQNRVQLIKICKAYGLRPHPNEDQLARQAAQQYIDNGKRFCF